MLPLLWKLIAVTSPGRNLLILIGRILMRLLNLCRYLSLLRRVRRWLRWWWLMGIRELLLQLFWHELLGRSQLRLKLLLLLMMMMIQNWILLKSYLLRLLLLYLSSPGILPSELLIAVGRCIALRLLLLTQPGINT